MTEETLIFILVPLLITTFLYMVLGGQSPQQKRLEKMKGEIWRRKDLLGQTPKDQVIRYIYYNMLDQLQRHDERASDVSRSASIMAAGASGMLMGFAMRNAGMTSDEVKAIWMEEQASIEAIGNSVIIDDD